VLYEIVSLSFPLYGADSMYLFFKDIKSLRRKKVIELPLKATFNKALLTYLACVEKLGSGVVARIN
jgi:hypothetical protein